MQRRDEMLSWPSRLDNAPAWNRASDLSITSPTPNRCTTKTTEVIMSRTWCYMTFSDDFKVCDTTIWPTLTMPVMHPAFWLTPCPVDSNTVGVGNTCIKTLKLSWFRTEQISAICMHVVINNPARWAARCFRTEHGVTWYTDKHFVNRHAWC